MQVCFDDSPNTNLAVILEAPNVIAVVRAFFADRTFCNPSREAHAQPESKMSKVDGTGSGVSPIVKVERAVIVGEMLVQ